MCSIKYRWNVKGWNYKSGAHHDFVVVSDKNPVQLADWLLAEKGEDFIIENMELTHRVEIHNEPKAVNL
jgi:hypothetical protein